MGHTDLLVISDAGFPIPPGVACVDLAVTAGLVLVLDLVPPRERKDHLGFISALGVVATLIVTYWMTFATGGAELRAFRGMVVLDGYALFFNIIIGYATGLGVGRLLVDSHRGGRAWRGGEPSHHRE